MIACDGTDGRHPCGITACRIGRDGSATGPNNPDAPRGWIDGRRLRGTGSTMEATTKPVHQAFQPAPTLRRNALP